MTSLERLKRAVETVRKRLKSSVSSENQQPIEDALHVLGQMENNGLVNSLELYDAYLERSANETNNADAQLTHQKILTQLRFFNTTDIPFEQVANFSKECRNILDLAIDFQLGTKIKPPITDLMPIYHDPDDELKLHILEIQMHNFRLLKQKDLTSLVSLFETFSAIFQPDNQIALKRTHLTAFLNYITLNLLKLKVDYGQGKLLTSLKHHLNFVKNEFNCLNLLAHEPLESDKRKVDLSLSLKQLDLIIQFKEQQYAPYYNCIKTLNSGFESLKRSVVMQSKSLKYIRKHMRQETLELVAKVLNSSDHVVKFNERIKDLLAHRYIDESLKLTVEKFLHEILQNAIDERINNPNLKNDDKKKCASVLKRFSLKKRKIFDSKLDDLSVKKETIVQLIMILFKYSNQSNSSKVRLSSSRIIELARMFDKYELWILSKQPNEKTKQIELKIGVNNSNQTTIMIDPSDDDLINSLTTNLPKKLALNNQDNFYRLLKEKYAIDLDSGLDRLVQYLTDLCDEFNLEKLKSQHLGKFNSKRMGKAPKQESMIAFDQFLERIYLSDSHAGSFRCKLIMRNSDIKPLSSEEEMAVRNGNAIYVLRNNQSEQLDIFYKLQQTTDDTTIYVETLAKPDDSVSVDSSQNESKETAMIRMKEKALYQLLSTNFREQTNTNFVDNDSESIIKCLSEYLAIKTKNLIHTCFDNNKLKSYRFEAEIIFEKLKAIKTIPDKFQFTFDKQRIEQQGIDYSAVLQNLNKFAANMDLLNQLKLLLNARIDIPKGLLDEVFEKLQNNFRLSKKSFNFDAMFDLIQIYEKNDEILTFQVNHEVDFLDQLKSHLKANSEAINQSLNNLNELIKNQQEQSSNDLNENKLQILLSQMVLNRLFNLNEQLYRKFIIKKCHMTLHKRLEETLMSNSNSNSRSKIDDKDFTLSTYYDMRNRLDQSIKNLFQQIDQFCDSNYLEAKRISIYTHLVDDLFEEIRFQPDCAPNDDGSDFLAETLKHFQSVRNQIDFFKERCIIKLSGLVESDNSFETEMTTKIQNVIKQCVIKRADLIFESANETQEQFTQRLEQLSTGHLFAILIKKLDSNQHEIYYVHETTNEIKNLAIEDTDQNRLITEEINPEKTHTQSSANFEFIYDAVFYNDGLIYSAPSLSMFYSTEILNIFSKFLEKFPLQNPLSIVDDDKQFERLLRYLEAFKLLVESLHQSDRQILIQIKRSTRTLVNGISSCEELNKSTDKQPNQQSSRLLLTLEYFQLFADMIDAKMQLTVDLLRMECKKLLQSGTIEYKNQLLNFAARHKPKLELCQPDELSKLVTKLAEFLFTIDYRSSTSVDLDDISIELARFEETLAIQSPVECLREMRDQIEHIKVYERLFSINDDDTLTIGKEQSDQRLNDELKKQNTEIRNGKILTTKELLNLVDLVVDKLNKATQINEEKPIGNSDKMQYEETLSNQLIKNLRLTVLENKNTTTDESLIIEPVIELERRLGKLNTANELNTTVAKEFYKFIKDSLRNAIEKKHQLFKDEFNANQNKIEKKMKEISDIYWKNVELSDLYNKERERAYLNVCLVKIIELEKKLFSDRNRSITDIHFETLSQISAQINQLQTNPDKIELTKVLFSSLNEKVNRYLLQLFNHKKVDDEFQLKVPKILPKTTLSQLIKPNDALENIVKLFEQLADSINKEGDMRVDEIETEDFLKGFNTIFEYLSWHNVGLCKDKKDELNKLYETLKKSVRKIESKQSKSNELERLKQLIYLRTNESLVQEELNMIKQKCLKRFQMIFELIQLNKKKVDEFQVTGNAIRLSQIISDNLSKINLEQSENELEELYMTFNNYSIVSSQENQTTDNSSQQQSYNYDFDGMNQKKLPTVKDIKTPTTSRDNKFNQDTQSKQPDIVNMLAEIKNSLADIDRTTQTESQQNLILFKIKTLNEFAYEKACNLTAVQKEHFAIEIDKLRKEIVDSLFKVCAQSNSGDNSSAVLREKLNKILMESSVEDWKYELDQLTLSQFSETLLKRCGLTFEIFEVDLNQMAEPLKRYDELAKNIWFKELEMMEFKGVIVDALSDVNANIDSLINQFDELTSLVKNFLLSQSDDTDSNALNEFVLFKKHSSKCLRNLVRLKRFKSAIQSAIFFLGVENFLKIVQIFYNKIGILKLNSVNKQPNDVQISLEKLIDLFQVLPNMRSAEQPIQIMIKFDPTKWQYYFNLQRLELAIFSYFERVLNNLEFKGLPDDSVCRKSEENGFDMIIKHVESEYHVEMKILADIGEKLRTHLDAIDKNEYLRLNEKEDVLKFLSNKVSLEVKKQPIAMISPKELESFMKLLISTRVCKTLTESMKHIDDDGLDESNETDDDDSSLATSQIDASNKRLFIHAVGFQSLQIVKPFLERVWIIDYLELEDYLLKTDQENLVQYLDQIKTIHNESIMYNLIELIHKCCKNEKRISQSITLALEKFAKQNWILNEEVLKLLDQLTSSNQWHKAIEAYTNEQRYKKRDLRELFRIMQKDAVEGINKSVASMLDNRQLLIKDIEHIIKLRQKPAEGFEELKNKSIDEWSVDDIKKWANYIKGMIYLKE